MRFARAILLANGVLWTGLAVAQTSPDGLPDATLGDAGQAAGYGFYVCDMPGGDIEDFKRRVDVLVPGGSGSEAFRHGEDDARKLVDRIRRSPEGDVSELRALVCNEAKNLMQRTAAAPK